MSHQFKGFDPDLMLFLTELSQNNNRQWFEENKTRYRERIQIPMSHFIMAFAPRLEKISPCFVADPRLQGGSMFRIYRDARFSHNKTPYKTNVGCQFRHDAGKNVHAPGFYFHIEPGEIFIGGGIYKPDSEALFKIRTAIAEKASKWQNIVYEKEFVSRFGEIYGESLKTSPKGFSAQHPCIEHLKKKTWFVTQALNEEDLYSPDLIHKVETVFNAAGPLMQFLTNALDLPYI